MNKKLNFTVIVFVFFSLLSGVTCSHNTVADVDLAPPGWTSQAVGYEIFVRSFADSDGDGIGDLKGLISKLDYLNDGKPGGQDLGVDLIWLMPIFPASSYHGYDVEDYLAINPEYGSLEDFEELVDQAHRRGIRVIIDLVINHSSINHPWFVESAGDPQSSKRDWYNWRADDPGWTQPWGNYAPVWHQKNGAYYYALYWYGMPDLNFENPDLLQEIEHIVLFWLERGVDGFRVDGARYLVENEDGTLYDTPKTHQVAKHIKEIARQFVDECIFVAEAWTNVKSVATYFGNADEYDLAFNFDFADALPRALKAQNPTDVIRVVYNVGKHFSQRKCDAPFFENHDMDRLSTALAGLYDQRLLRIAAVLLLALPGTPFVYYGQELGLANATECSGDVCRRAPMPWTNTQTAGFTEGTPWTPFSADSQTQSVETQVADRDSLLSFYRKLIDYRRTYPGLTSNQLVRCETDQDQVYAFIRGDSADQVLIVINFSDQAIAQMQLDLSAFGLSDSELAVRELLTEKIYEIPIERTAYQFESLDAYQVMIITK
jgi:glycosidase